MTVLSQKQSLASSDACQGLGTFGIKLTMDLGLSVVEWVTAVFSPTKGDLKIILISSFIFVPRVKLAIDGM